MGEEGSWGPGSLALSTSSRIKAWRSSYLQPQPVASPNLHSDRINIMETNSSSAFAEFERYSNEKLLESFTDNANLPAKRRWVRMPYYAWVVFISDQL